MGLYTKSAEARCHVPQLVTLFPIPTTTLPSGTSFMVEQRLREVYVHHI